MKLTGVCITTDDAPRLAAFYKVFFQTEPLVEGSHYGFGMLSVWDSGDVTLAKEKSIWLQFMDADIDALYERLLRDVPGIVILSPPERKPWDAYSFWFLDPDGNKVAVAQKDGAQK